MHGFLYYRPVKVNTYIFFRTIYQSNYSYICFNIFHNTIINILIINLYFSQHLYIGRPQMCIAALTTGNRAHFATTKRCNRSQYARTLMTAPYSIRRLNTTERIITCCLKSYFRSLTKRYMMYNLLCVILNLLAFWKIND